MRFPKCLVIFSEALNTLTCGPRGYSLCARVYEAALMKGGWRWTVVKAVDKLFWFDKKHCYKSWRCRQ